MLKPMSLASRFLLVTAAFLAAACGRKMHRAQPIESQTVTVAGIPVHVEQSGPKDGRPLLFLHGGRFSSATWKELGTLNWFGSRGFRAVAVDLPGFGKTPESDLEEGQFLKQLGQSLKMNKPAVVAPSMSGRFLWPLVASEPDWFGALIPVAPVGIEEAASTIESVNIPALIVWGDQDQVIPISMADRLAGMLVEAQNLILLGAPHPCYLERTQEFHDGLLKFLDDQSSS
ncbi:MAG: alpha/beta hydrolase [Planctomycetota bacterium]|nr:MAG: alpha/beta hydrolase [Planctomycetota bacterium]